MNISFFPISKVQCSSVSPIPIPVQFPYSPLPHRNSSIFLCPSSTSMQILASFKFFSKLTYSVKSITKTSTENHHYLFQAFRSQLTSWFFTINFSHTQNVSSWQYYILLEDYYSALFLLVSLSIYSTTHGKYSLMRTELYQVLKNKQKLTRQRVGGKDSGRRNSLCDGMRQKQLDQLK